ncbi:hypothetical protein QBC40DRAFT_323675 [Triangularia verruculosa]|uniref:Rhodopsin domain-containing protein n=1 Tax=Triangularia verruculosa TaxID=2587418 RepID=A0AAN7AUL2_9PEZI|nr:hypothetical protein QBC40DRAFT_323675 [Triangularia verruculosa]
MFEYVEFPILPIVKTHLIINCVLAFITLTIISLRLFARFLTGAGLWWDDYLILFAVPQGMAMVIIQGMWAPMGVGYPMAQTLPNLEHILKMLVSYELIYATGISTIKLSVLVFYLRVFVNKTMRTATKGVIIFVCLWSVGNILQVFLICRPFAAIYTLELMPTAKCGDQVGSFIAIGAFNIITDVMILTLPIPTVWTLKTTRGKKIALTAVFLVGLLVSVVAMIRIITLTRLDLVNLTESMIWADFWSATEPNLGIFCVSLPMLGTLWTRYFSRKSPSKLDPYHSSENGTHGTRGTASNNGFSKLRNAKNNRTDPGVDTIICMEDLYAPNKEVCHKTDVAAVAAPVTPDGGDGGMMGGAPMNRANSSEEALTGRQQGGEDPYYQRQQQQSEGIRVQTKWTISVD